MARAPLIASRRGRFALVCAIVLAAHVVVILWVRYHLEMLRLLKPMPPAMYTRLVEAHAPPAPPSVAHVEPAPAPKKPAVTAINRPLSPLAIEPMQPIPQIAQLDVPTPKTPPRDTPQTPPSPTSDPSPDGSASAVAAPSLPGESTTQTWPTDTQLTYRVTGNYRGALPQGSARVQWQRDGARYQVRIEMEVPLLYSLVLTSQGDILPTGLAPRAYEETQRGKVRDLRLGDDAITLGDGRVVPRPVAVQDTASQFIELSHRFQMGTERLDVPGQVSLWLARPGGVDLWVYDIVEREQLETYAGTVEAFHLKPRPLVNPRGNIYPDIWFAPGLLYLPVRIRINSGEAFIDLMVEKIEQ